MGTSLKWSITINVHILFHTQMFSLIAGGESRISLILHALWGKKDDTEEAGRVKDSGTKTKDGSRSASTSLFYRDGLLLGYNR